MASTEAGIPWSQGNVKVTDCVEVVTPGGMPVT